VTETVATAPSEAASGHGSTVIWTPTAADESSSRLRHFLDRVETTRGVRLESYREALDWSVTNLSDFWDSLRDFFDVIGDGFDGPALAEEQMPGAVWYPNARINFAENILRHALDPAVRKTTAILHLEEDGSTTPLTWSEFARRVGGFAESLRALGVKPGDRVVAVLPNLPEAIIGLLASASIGATWCICSPDLAAKATLERLAQLDPVVLIGTNGYNFNGKWFERIEHFAAVRAGLPTVRHTIVVGESTDESLLDFAKLSVATAMPAFERVPFDHPLWVLFTSGTSGAPKGIVHGHGGMILEMLKMFGLHFDMRPGDRYYVAANTSWMVWNTVLGNLVVGASVVTYAGSPTYPSPDRQFDIVASTGVTMMATGAAYLQLVQGAGVAPGHAHNLSNLKIVMSTGSTLPDKTYQWVHDSVNARTHLCDTSGGTDICSAFVGPNPLEPVVLGRIQGALLGVAVEVRDDDGKAVIDRVGELVITRPMPSMPISFWGDADGARYHAAYFDQFPGVWTHGDWALEAANGTFEIVGRSDATLNRAGVRLGSAEIYGALQGTPGVRDSLVLGIELPQGEYYLPLFVVLADGAELDDALRGNIIAAIRRDASARHVPDDILVAPAIPITHAGKKIEIPLKRLFAGGDPAKLDRGAVANPDALDWFVAEAQRFRKSRGLE
jgi:acetoacetyl-CoA synthetase